MQDRRKRPINWSSAIGWLIFILVIAGGPLLSLLRQALSGLVTLPNNLVPLLAGAIVALSILASVVRAAMGASNRARNDTRLPAEVAPPSVGTPRLPTAPMPPFAGPSQPAQPISPPSPRSFVLPTSSREQLPRPPRFEPVFNSTILLVGIVGVLLLAGAGLLVFGLSLP